MARGDNITKGDINRTPPENGGLSKEEIADAVLMDHPDKHSQYIPRDLVARKEKRGWRVVNANPRPEPADDEPKRGPGRPRKVTSES